MPYLSRQKGTCTVLYWGPPPDYAVPIIKPTLIPRTLSPFPPTLRLGWWHILYADARAGRRRRPQGEVEALWDKLAKREKELNMSKIGARDLSHVVKEMKSALEKTRQEAKTMRRKIAALEVRLWYSSLRFNIPWVMFIAIYRRVLSERSPGGELIFSQDRFLLKPTLLETRYFWALPPNV